MTLSRLFKLFPLILILVLCFCVTSFAEEAEPVYLDLSAEIFQEGGLPHQTTGTATQPADPAAAEIGDGIGGAVSNDALYAADYSEAREYLYQQLLQFADVVDVYAYRIPVSEVSAFYSETLNRHPDLFYVYGGLSYSYRNGYLDSLLITYKYDTDTCMRMSEELRAAVDAAVAYADLGSTPLMKALRANEYFCANYEYDYTYSRYTAYEIMTEGSGVCQAYMLAYTLVLDRMGIPSVDATSEAMNHTWNVIQLDGSWYHVDVTWNDAATPNHNYFLRSDSAIPKHHDWVCAVNAVDPRYDDAFWIATSGALLTDADGAYYVVPLTSPSCQICRWNSVDNSTSVLHNFSARWWIGSNYNAPYGSFYQGYWGCMTMYRGALYYVVPSGVVRLATDGSSAEQVLTVPNGNGSIYVSHFENNTLYYTVGTDFDSPTYSDTWVIPSTGPDPEKILLLPAGLTTIQPYAFTEISAEGIEAPQGLQTIGGQAFANCAELVYVYLPASVTSIAPDAFDGCSEALVFCCETNSYAWNWAVSHGFSAEAA